MHNNIIEITINKNEFINFYLCYSADIKNDEYFEILLNNVWHLTEQIYEYVKEVAEEEAKPVKKQRLNVDYEKSHHKEGGDVPFGTDKKFDIGDYNPDKKTKKQSNVLINLIKQLRKRGTRGIMSLRRSFDIADSNKNGTIDFSEFQDMANNVLRLSLKPNELDLLFKEFDKDSNNEIDYLEFINTILGDLPLERISRLKQVFYTLDKDNSGTISQDELKDGYFYKRHPDVLHAKKSPEEVYCEFLDNIEYHFNLLGEGRKDLNFDEFIDFYRNISFTYESDNSFLDTLKAVWKLD